MAQLVAIPDALHTQAQHLLSTIGNTPLLRLDKIAREFPGVQIYAKAEYFNPGGSAELGMSQRDTLLRWVAKRRGIAVPALAADAATNADPVPVPTTLTPAPLVPTTLTVMPHFSPPSRARSLRSTD